MNYWNSLFHQPTKVSARRRGVAGLVLLSLSFMIAPFGYWLSFKWALVALLFGVAGSFLYFTARTARKFLEQDPGAADVYPSRDMKGFNGASFFDDNHDE